MRYPDGGGLTAKQRAQREQVRFQATELLAEGAAPPQVAQRLRVSRKSAYDWHARWRDGGVEALRSKGPPGRPSRIKPTWRAWLPQSWRGGRPRTAGCRTSGGRRPGGHGDRATLPWPLQPCADLAHPAPDGLHGAASKAPGRRAGPRCSGHLDRGDVASCGKTVRDQGAWLCFADESGQVLRAAESTDLVPAWPHAPRHRPGRRLGTYLAGRPGVPQAGPTHPAHLPDAGAPWPQG